MEFNLSSLTSEQIELLVKDLLNQTKIITNVEHNKPPFSRTGLSKYQPDLISFNESRVEEIVEVKAFKRVPKKFINETLRNIGEFYKSYYPNRFILVITIPVQQDFIDELVSAFEAELPIEVQVLDSRWLDSTIRLYPEIAKRYNLLETIGSKKATNSEDLLELMKPFLELDDSSNTFIVGYDSTIKIKEFFDRSFWETEFEIPDETLKSVKEGDVFFLKSAITEEDKLFLSIEAVGIVTSFAFQGQRFNVDWERLKVEIDVPYDDLFINSIARIDGEYRTRIYGRILGKISEFSNILNKLIERNREAFKRPDDYKQSDLKATDRSSYKKEFNSVLRELKINDKIGEKRKFYVGGHRWGSDDHYARFLRESIWENGWEDKFLDRVNSVEEGDIFFLKATVRRGKLGFLRLKVVGVVEKNHHNGRLLSINWFEFPEMIEMRKGAHLRSAIQVIGENFIDVILGALLDEDANFPSVIEQLQNGHRFENIIEEKRIESQEEEEELDYDIDEESDEPILQRFQNAKLSKSGFNSDWAFEKRDLLNIENDVRAFAILLASRDVRPPLAIALFGRWGAGKSFFMKHLEKRIRELSSHQTFWDRKNIAGNETILKDPEAYCHGIAHIWFNAWSYLDSNLWAGLAHSLFEKLNEYITDQSKGEIEKLKVQVRLTRRLQLLHNDLENFKEKRENLEGLKSKLLEEKDKRIARYFAPKYDKEVKIFLKENGVEEGLINELSPQRLKEKVELATNLIGFFKKNSKQVFTLVIPLMIGLFLCKQLLAIWWDAGSPYLESLWANISAFVLPIWFSAKRFYKSKKDILEKIGSFVQELSSKAKESEKELKELQSELDEIDPVIEEIEESLNREYALGSDVTRLAIANFISSKSNQKDYIDRLGIVSIIRKDFETLSELFYPEVENNNTLEYQDQLEEDREYINSQFKDDKKLERIILYIDDLDRCADNKVLEVIQAVHLLMAFPLFNVVVGVDSRCIHNALNYQYMLRYNQFKGENNFENRIHEIKPEEYIEKIFQIPFRLNDPDSKDIEKLIDHLLSNQLDPPDGTPSYEVKDSLELTPDKKSKQDEQIDLEESASESENLEKGYSSKPENEVNDEGKDESIGIEFREVIDAATDLKLSHLELAAIKAMSFLVGNVPRTIKRYINIYRIIRSHEQLEYDEDRKMDHFKGILFMLALSVGDHKEIAEEYFISIDVDPRQTIGEYNKKFAQLKDFADHVEKREELKGLLDITGELLMRHLPFVKRFSFARVSSKIEEETT